MSEKGNGASDQFVGWGIVIVIVAILCYILYRIWTPEILGTLRWVRYAQIWLIAMVTPSDFVLTLNSGDQVNVQDWLDGIARIPNERMTFNLFATMTEIALTPFKWFVVVFISGIGIWTYLKGPGTHYVKKFDLNSFIEFQAQNFPVIAPFVDFNPNKLPPRSPGMPVPAKLPLFAEALGPEEWIAYNQLPMPDGKLDEEATFKAFARQLGKRWKGAHNLDPYKQVLLAAFCLKAARKRDASDIMLGELAKCWSHDKGLQLNSTLVRKARKILRNKDLSHSTLKKCNQHAWETTAIMRGLLSAREDGGVLAPAQFVWLRGYDRNLWYPLNNVGRQSNNAEAIGAMSHFRAEQKAKRPIPIPKMKDAVDSLVEYMDSGNARPIPTLDYSYSENKRGIKKLKKAKA